MDLARYVTLEDLAEKLSVSKRHLRRLVSTGELPAVRIGAGRDALRVSLADVEQILQPVVPRVVAQRRDELPHETATEA